MTVAISLALEAGLEAVVCASTGNTAACGGLRGARGHACGRAAARRRGCRGQACPDPSAGRSGARRPGQLRRCPRGSARACGPRDPRARQLPQPAPTGRPEDRRVRDRRRAGWRPGRDRTSLWRRWQPPCVRARVRGGGLGMPRIVAGEAARRADTLASAIRIARPAHATEAAEAVAASEGEVVALSDDEIVEAWRELATREGLFCEPSSAAGLAALARARLARPARIVCVVTGHGLRTPRRQHERPLRRWRSIPTRRQSWRPPRECPRTGPRAGEHGQHRPGIRLRRGRARPLERARGDRGRRPSPADHLGVRAFSLLAPTDGRRFQFVDRIPRERGLGSSASVIALGLLAACAVSGRALDPEELLAAGVELEGHADNLAAVLAGGVCLTWDGRIARLADGHPLPRSRSYRRRPSRPPRHGLPCQNGSSTVTPRSRPRARHSWSLDRTGLHGAVRGIACRPSPRAVSRRTDPSPRDAAGGAAAGMRRRHRLGLGPDPDRVGTSRCGSCMRSRARPAPPELSVLALAPSPLGAHAF